MARGGGSSSSGGGAGGIMGSGIFGFFGTTIQCPASDTSLYCSFMKIFNVLMVVGIIIFILYTAYSYFTMNRSVGKRR
jgi:hypothetical protein